VGERLWEELPTPLRARLAEMAATAVGGLPAADVPATLRQLARFTPRKRARAGAGQLIGELAGSPAFRSTVLAWWVEHHDQDDDPISVAARALLAEEQDADEMIAGIAERAGTVALRAERDAALARVDKLTGELERFRSELAEARDAARAADTVRDSEIQRLRTKVREQGSRLRAAEDTAEQARRELSELREMTERRVSTAEAAVDRERARAAAERTRATRASEAATDAQEVASSARRADEARLELLVETLAGAVDGLRRELSLGAGGPRPADLVAGASERGEAGRSVADIAGLDRLLALPGTHLIVDGYNVSKTGYGELTLFEQRSRLIGGLGVLAARTGAEVTCVFDGAAVRGSPDRRPRGVRVLFSRAGVLADDVIRELVAAEPSGRPLVVVTCDRAVADGVRRDGAYAVPSPVLLERLARG
jgi:predicted RNA-binding protein with PIN domain